MEALAMRGAEIAALCLFSLKTTQKKRNDELNITVV